MRGVSLKAFVCLYVYISYETLPPVFFLFTKGIALTIFCSDYIYI